jgi:GNAT superfamily N-acetyltransferase
MTPVTPSVSEAAVRLAPISFVPATVETAEALTEIAVAAKSHWGYPPGWLNRWRKELTITPGYLANHTAFTAVLEGRMAGFYALHLAAGEALLDHLWVRPSCMRQGVGRALFEHAEATARKGGARCLKITGDPNAEEFYVRMGAKLYGRQPAAMDERERFLPLFEKALQPPA